MSSIAIERPHVPQLSLLRRHPKGHSAATELSVFRSGTSNVPLLMLNGVGADYGLWQALRRNIKRTTIAFDVESRHLGSRPSFRTFVQSVAEVLDEHGVDQVDVLGLSWGGFAAQQLAHDLPERVRRMVLASTSPGFYSIPAPPSSYLELRRPSRSAHRAEKLSKHLYGGDFVQDPTLIHQLGVLRPTDTSTYRRQMWATMGWSSLPWLRSLPHQTLVLHGDDDPIIPFVNARLMQKLLPQARLDRVRGGGHLYLLTRPKVLGPQISEFLDAPSPV